MNRKSGILGNLDGWLVFFYFFLVIFGWLNIYSSSSTEESRQILNFSTSHGKQLLWMGVCFLFALLIMLFDSRFYTNFWYVFYGGSIVLLVLVLIIGQEVDGNKAWIVISGSIKLQPSEFAKIGTALAVAAIVSRKEFTFKKFRFWFIAFTIIVFPAALILLEDDTGTTLVFFSLVLVLFRFGLPWIILIIGVSLVTLFFMNIVIPFKTMLLIILISIIPVFFIIRLYTKTSLTILFTVIIVGSALGFSAAVQPTYKNVLKPHQQTRIKVLLGIEKDRRGAAWNVYNSKVAIGSGGMWGKGYLNGSFTKLKFIPKQRTDFIFSTVGEEWGFWGSSIVLLIYLAFLIRLVLVADRQRNRFHMAYGYCVACLMFFHYFMNIGTTIGLAPAVGVPLPFFSYGGSSLLGFTLLFWIFVKMDSQNLQILR